ncbi:pitrilysin family protein [Cytophagales bacterium LB-30]|uniref:Pitrilysin family protein n=1 Tax=Shiella aurantiaca TaxID=3058365 RepID=A0ABT8F6X9_9BACT|nr:pitrilysin family protein [Shiella aurantiaca]MDN4166243.1 pitrilysin family protein [Shiella aurantiaca]
MIQFEEFTLANGLQVFVHEDHSLPMAAVNLLYKVGSRDEREDKTGFAHLFEHLMFGGSKHIPSYDEPLQKVGGENNAFTSPDITNYYITLPSSNLETAFWLESDRMLSLNFDPEVLEVQRKVVIEEFKQRYLNQPYGDVWLKLRPHCYKVHPYRWATIGKDISHIEQATMEDVQSFFFTFYRPNNAILVVAGDVTLDQVKALSEKWFGPIEAGKAYKRNILQEPVQTEARLLEVEANVPLNAFYKAFHMPARGENAYYTADLLSDLLGRGKSSRLYDRLVKRDKVFNSISAFVTGSIDPGLLMINGNLNEGVDFAAAEKAVNEILEEVINQGIEEAELSKVKNQAEASLAFGEVELLNRAMNLAYAAFLGNPDLINQEADIIERITASEIQDMARKILVPSNCCTMYYHAKNK